MAMGETTYPVGSIVWVKLTGGKWWPGEVVAADSCPAEVFKGSKKDPLAIVKFFDEDYYELVKMQSNIQPFTSAKRKEFIKKGRELLKLDPFLEKFEKDVAAADKMCDINDFISSETLDAFPLGNHLSDGDFPRPEHNHGSALVASSLPLTSKPFSPTILNESNVDANESSPSFSTSNSHSTPIDVRIRTQPSGYLSSSGGSFCSYSCDVCSFQTSRIANIIVHHKSHTDLYLHRWPPVTSNSKEPLGKSKANSDSKLPKQREAPSSSLKKVKRKLLSSDKKAKKSKAHSTKKADGKSAIQSDKKSEIDDAVQATKVKAADEKESPKKKKKEDDSDAVFEKVKKSGMKRMNRKRGHSYMGMSSSSSPLKTFKRDGDSDESSDGGEFLIMREDIDSKEEELDDDGPLAQQDDADQISSSLMETEVEDLLRTDEVLGKSSKDEGAIQDFSQDKSSAEDSTTCVDAYGSSHKETSELNVEEPQSEDAKVDEPQSEDAKIDEPQPEDVEVDEPQPEDVKVDEPHPEDVKVNEPQSERVQVNEPQSDDVKVDEPQAEKVQVCSTSDNPDPVKDNGHMEDSHHELLGIPLPKDGGSSSFDAGSSDHSYDRVVESNNLQCSTEVTSNYHSELEQIEENHSSRMEPELPPLPPPLPPTPPPPPPPPSPPANDYVANINIDPGDIPLPPSDAPEPPKDKQLRQDISVVSDEPPLEYTKLETLVQPPNIPMPSDDVYSVIVEETTVEVPRVEGHDIMHIGNEQVIDTSMDVFCNEIVIESDDKSVEGVVEYEDICLMTEDKAKLMETSGITCVGSTQLVTAENGSIQSELVISQNELNQAR